MSFHGSESKMDESLDPSFWGLGGSVSAHKKKPRHDRFVPNLVGTNLYNIFNEQAKDKKQEKPTQSSKYSDLLEEQMLKYTSKKILRFTEQQSKENHFSQSNLNIQKPEEVKKPRKISNKPYKELDAPCLKDDFYLNLIDWSSSNQIGAGLKTGVIVWSGCLSRIQKIYQSEDSDNIICSVAFPKFSNQIGFGDSQGKVLIYDLTKKLQVTSVNTSSDNRIGSLACTSNMLCTGSKNGIVSVYDFRQNKSVASWKAHEQEICGIKWSHDGQMIASGGNDNKMSLFSLKTMTRMAEFSQHKAAVKALAFDPHSPMIATGGGSADKCLRFFSTQTLQEIYSKDTGSQICNILFSPVSQELVTTHGFSLNQINVYKVNKESKAIKTSTLTGHKCRVLYLAGQSHGPRIVTGAGDQSLKFWNVFQQDQSEVDHFDLR